LPVCDSSQTLKTATIPDLGNLNKDFFILTCRAGNAKDRKI